MPHKSSHKHRPSQKTSRPFVDPTGMKGFKSIEDFRGDYKDSTCWILGSDPNLALYPDDFFNNKFSIAANASCIAFPDSTFFVLTSNPFASCIKYVRPDFLTKYIMPFNSTRPAKSLPFWEQLDPHWEDYGLKPIYLKLIVGTRAAQTQADWDKMIEQIFGTGLIRFLQPFTIIHYAIEVAAVLGAKRIILVGCSHKYSDYPLHSLSRGMWLFCREEHSDAKRGLPLANEWLDREFDMMRKDTIKFKEVFAKHGVEVVRHRFDEARGAFVFEEIKAA